MTAHDVSAAEMREQLDRILAHPRFATAERFRSFLRFTVGKVLAGESAEIKEYLIALEVYGRGADYDPKVDSIVRVEAARVRTRLKEYYDSDGAADPVILELPKGSYVPVFRRVAEATPSAPAAATEPERHFPWRLVGLATLGMLALAAVGWMLTRPKPAPVRTIAVLQFTNLASDAQLEPVAHGIRKQLEDAFTQSGNFRVVSASANSARSADLLLEGTVRGDRESLAVVVQLLSSREGAYIWSRTFERPSATSLSSQQELARAIHEASEEQASSYAQEIAATGSPRAKALNLYRQAKGQPAYASDRTLMRGTSQIELLPLSDLNRGISFLEQAVTIDSKFAAGWTALASFYQAAAEYDPRMREKAKAAARRAIAIQPNHGEAHWQLGYVLFLYDWKLTEAAEEFGIASELEPRIVALHRLNVDVLSILGRHQEAIDTIIKARRIFPKSEVIETAIGSAYYHAGRYAEMEQQGRQIIAQFPEFPLGYWILGLALEQLGRLPEAIAAQEKCLVVSPGEPRCIVASGHMYALAGRKSEALAIVAKARSRPATQAKALYVPALIFDGLGDIEQAYASLEAAVAGREFDVLYARIEPRLANLRKDPRFNPLLARAGL